MEQEIGGGVFKNEGFTLKIIDDTLTYFFPCFMATDI